MMMKGRLYHIALRDGYGGQWKAGDLERCAEHDSRDCYADGRDWATFEADDDPEVLLFE